MRYVLALDQGTTSSRAILFDERGAPVSAAQREFRQIYPDLGWVEHDPKEIFRTQRDVAREVVQKAKVALSDVMAVGITNQRETTLLWDRQTGEPLHNAIVWQDRRTAAMCDELKQVGAESLVSERTGLVIDPYFSGTKLAWLLDEIPGARRRAERGELAFGTVDTWLVWQLTNGKVHATDVSNASRTLFLNLRTGEWDDELLRTLRITREVLPQVRASSEVYGHVESIPVLRGVPISGVAGDKKRAFFGRGVF